MDFAGSSDADKALEDQVDAIVKEACRVIETVQIPANPKDPTSTAMAWRLRPSELRAIALKEYLEPPTPWGLKINLAGLCIGPARSERVGRSLILNRTVTALDMSGSDMGTDACTELFRCLERNNVLKHINLNGNFVEAKAVATPSASQCIQKLETLHMACNLLGTRGALAISSALSESKSIKFLNVRGNGISVYGVFRLIEALDPTVVERLSEECKQIIGNSRREYSAQNESSRSVNSSKIDARSNLEDSTGSASPLSNLRRSASFAGSLPQQSLNASSPPTRKAAQTTPLQSGHPMSIPDVDSGSPMNSHLRGINQTSSFASQSINTPRSATPPSFDPSKSSNTSCHALWVQGNLPAPQELLDCLNGILTKRVPQPPEGLNQKKKGKGKKAK